VKQSWGRMMNSALKSEMHVKQWRHNRRFAKTIDSNFRDWQINVIFYTALHAVDAALAKLGVCVEDHTTRNEAVKSNSSFAGIRDNYLNLYRISRITRYDADPDKWIPEKYLTVTDLVEDLLRPIENGLTAIVPDVKFAVLSLHG
jgi:hypothetical protein